MNGKKTTTATKKSETKEYYAFESRGNLIAQQNIQPDGESFLPKSGKTTFILRLSRAEATRVAAKLLEQLNQFGLSERADHLTYSVWFDDSGVLIKERNTTGRGGGEILSE